MKKILTIITSFIIVFGTFLSLNANASVDFDSITGKENITDHSITNISKTGDITNDLETVGLSLLTIAKYVLSGLLVVFIVYAGIQMIMSMGNDEEKLSSSKKQLRYTMIGFIFINIPGTIYKMFNGDRTQVDGSINNGWTTSGDNIFVNTFLFDQTLNGGIVTFIEVVLFSVAVFVITIAGIQIISSRGREEKLTESKNKIMWSIIGLIFVGFIEAWQNVVYNGKISDGANLFQAGENLALFFAGPVAIFFLTLAGYYYITSNGDEEKVKKAKSIIINTVIATVILLASHAFLKDLLTL